jgi:hypothetical protein
VLPSLKPAANQIVVQLMIWLCGLNRFEQIHCLSRSFVAPYRCEDSHKQTGGFRFKRGSSRVAPDARNRKADCRKQEIYPPLSAGHRHVATGMYTAKGELKPQFR